MAEQSVETAIYSLGLDPSQYNRAAADAARASENLALSAGKVTVAEESVTRATRTSADSLDRMLGRLDPVIRAEQQRERGLAQIARLEQEGIGTAERRAQAAALVNRRHDESIARLNRLGGATSDANRGFAGFSATMSRLTPILGAFGVTLGAAGLVSFTRQTIDAIGGLGELAESMGVTTQGLQSLEFGAIQAGLKTEELRAGIAFLTRTVGEAAQGNDEAIKKFERLGIGVLDAGGKVRGTERILVDIAKAIGRFDDAAQKGAAAADLFGARSGSKLLPVLPMVAEGLDVMAAKAREAGTAVDDELIARFDELSDKSALFAKRMTVTVAEAVDESITRIDRLGTALRLIPQLMAQLPRGGLSAPVPTTPRVSMALPPPPSPAPDFESSAFWAGRTSNPVSDAERKREAGLEKYMRGLETQAKLERLVGAEKEAARAVSEAQNRLLDEAGNMTRQLSDAEHARITRATLLVAEARKAHEWKKAELETAAALAQAEEQQREAASKRAQSIISDDAKRNRGVESYIAGLEQAAQLEKLVGVERDVSRATLDAQSKLIDEQGIKLRDLTQVEKARIDTAVRLKDRIEHDARLTQATIAEVTSFADRAFDKVGSSFEEFPPDLLADAAVRQGIETQLEGILQ